MRVDVNFHGQMPINSSDFSPVTEHVIKNAKTVQELVKLQASLIAQDAIERVNTLIKLGVQRIQFDANIKGTASESKHYLNVHDFIINGLQESRGDLRIDWLDTPPNAVLVLENAISFKKIPQVKNLIFQIENSCENIIYEKTIDMKEEASEIFQRRMGTYMDSVNEIALKMIKSASKQKRTASLQMNLFKASRGRHAAAALQV